jgi:sugar porter (SP) family MFS transporter
LLNFIPFSPRWLISKGRNEEAKKVLQDLSNNEQEANASYTEIMQFFKQESGKGNEVLFCKKYTKLIWLAIAIAAFNQLSGINAVLYYAPHIFQMAGAGVKGALLQSVIIGGTNLIFTMLALLVIDMFGRRKLMLIGSVGYIISLGTLAATFFKYGTNFTDSSALIVLGSLVLFIASHAFGQGAVIWVFISEIFPNSIRAKGLALGSFTHWIMAALISWTFPIIAGISGGVIFTLYALCMAGQLFWVLFIMPETKGIPLEKMNKELGIE